MEGADGAVGPEGDLLVPAIGGNALGVRCDVVMYAREALRGEVRDAEGDEEGSDQLEVLRLQQGEVAGGHDDRAWGDVEAVLGVE